MPTNTVALPSGETELLLRGNATHTSRVQATAHGTTRALEHVVNNLEDTRSQRADHLVQRRLGDLRVQMDVPFEHAARQKELVDALDLSADAVVREARNLYDQWPKLSAEEKRRIAEAMLEKITLGEDNGQPRLELTLSYLPTSEEPCSRSPMALVKAAGT